MAALVESYFRPAACNKKESAESPYFCFASRDRKLSRNNRPSVTKIAHTNGVSAVLFHRQIVVPPRLDKVGRIYRSTVQ